VTKLSCR